MIQPGEHKSTIKARAQPGQQLAGQCAWHGQKNTQLFPLPGSAKTN